MIHNNPVGIISATTTDDPFVVELLPEMVPLVVPLLGADPVVPSMAFVVAFASRGMLALE